MPPPRPPSPRRPAPAWRGSHQRIRLVSQPIELLARIHVSTSGARRELKHGTATHLAASTEHRTVARRGRRTWAPAPKGAGTRPGPAGEHRKGPALLRGPWRRRSWSWIRGVDGCWAPGRAGWIGAVVYAVAREGIGLDWRQGEPDRRRVTRGTTAIVRQLVRPHSTRLLSWRFLRRRRTVTRSHFKF